MARDSFWFLVGLLGFCSIMPCTGVGMIFVPIIRANGTTMTYFLICFGIVAIMTGGTIIKDGFDSESPWNRVEE